MTKLTIYHNRRCAKSRETLEILEEKGREPSIIEYMKTPIQESELRELIKKLDIDPLELVRKSEPVYKERFRDKKMSDTKWIRAMIKHPELMQRPIVVRGEKAVIGRPPENIKKLF